MVSLWTMNGLMGSLLCVVDKMFLQTHATFVATFIVKFTLDRWRRRVNLPCFLPHFPLLIQMTGKHFLFMESFCWGNCRTIIQSWISGIPKCELESRFLGSAPDPLTPILPPKKFPHFLMIIFHSGFLPHVSHCHLRVIYFWGFKGEEEKRTVVYPFVKLLRTTHFIRKGS